MRISTISTIGPQGPKGDPGSSVVNGDVLSIHNLAEITRTNILLDNTITDNYNLYTHIDDNYSLRPADIPVNKYVYRISSLILNENEITGYVLENNIITFDAEIQVSTDIHITFEVESIESELVIKQFIGTTIDLSGKVENITTVELEGVELTFTDNSGIITVTTEETPITKEIVVCGEVDGFEAYVILNGSASTEIDTLPSTLEIITIKSGTAMVPYRDFVFYRDRQIIYFIGECHGIFSIFGRTYYNGEQMDLAIKTANADVQLQRYKISTVVEPEEVTIVSVERQHQEFITNPEFTATIITADQAADSLHIYLKTENGQLSFIDQYYGVINPNGLSYFDFNIPIWEQVDKLYIGESVSTGVYIGTLSQEITDPVDLTITAFVDTQTFTVVLEDYIGTTFSLTDDWTSVTSVKINGTSVSYTYSSGMFEFEQAIDNDTVELIGSIGDQVIKITMQGYSLDYFSTRTFNSSDTPLRLANVIDGTNDLDYTYTEILEFAEGEGELQFSEKFAYFLHTPIVNETITISGTDENQSNATYTVTEFSGSKIRVDAAWIAVSNVAVEDVAVEFYFNDGGIILTTNVQTPSTLKITGIITGELVVDLEIEDFTGDYKDLTTIVFTINDIKNSVQESLDYTIVTDEVIFNELDTQLLIRVVGSIQKNIGGIDTTISVIYSQNGVTGNSITLPTEIVRPIYAILYNSNFENWNRIMYLYYLDNKLYFMEAFPTSGSPGLVQVYSTIPIGQCLFAISDWFGNEVQMCSWFDEVYKVTNGSNIIPTIFDYNKQHCLLAKNITGGLSYKAAACSYLGVASGGETVRVIGELPGLMATTCGTGEHIDTLLTKYNKVGLPYVDMNFGHLAVFDDDDIEIFKDEQSRYSVLRNGYTDPEITPLTPRLPFSGVWAEATRSDKALINLAFTPDENFPYLSSTYLELVDSIRVSENSVQPDTTIVLSSNNAVRGKQGVIVDGPIPVYYGGSLTYELIMSAYKWLIVEITDNNDNANLSIGDKCLLCVQNSQMDNKMIACQLTSTGYMVAADLFKIEEID